MGSDFYQVLWKSKLSGVSVDRQLINRRKNGEIYNVLAHISPIKNSEGQILGWIATEEDISPIKKAEADVVKSSSELDNFFQISQDIMGIATLRVSFYGDGEKQRNIRDFDVKTNASDIDAVVDYVKEQGSRWVCVIGHSYSGMAIVYSNKQAFDTPVLWDASHTYGYDEPQAKNYDLTSSATTSDTTYSPWPKVTFVYFYFAG